MTIVVTNLCNSIRITVKVKEQRLTQVYLWIVSGRWTWTGPYFCRFVVEGAACETNGPVENIVWSILHVQYTKIFAVFSCIKIHSNSVCWYNKDTVLDRYTILLRHSYENIHRTLSKSSQVFRVTKIEYKCSIYTDSV
jgi:hypothetical protein